jgi:hypothetical protein
MTEDSIAIKLVLDNGKSYKTAMLPADIEQGPLGQCFDWCALQAVQHRNYRYVEGVASDPTDPDNWILHAWLTDGEHAFDPTWYAESTEDAVRRPVPSDYIGIEMDILDVAAFMRVTGYQGILGNYWRNTKLADECLGLLHGTQKGI